MESRPESEWPHTVGTWRDCIGPPIKLEVYSDHEFPENAAAYHVYASGAKLPVRSVCPNPREHWNSVMLALQSSYRISFEDHRNNPVPPIPIWNESMKDQELEETERLETAIVAAVESLSALASMADLAGSAPIPATGFQVAALIRNIHDALDAALRGDAVEQHKAELGRQMEEARRNARPFCDLKTFKFS